MFHNPSGDWQPRRGRSNIYIYDNAHMGISGKHDDDDHC